MERYFIDERSGCLAVRDNGKTNPDDYGLHEDTKGVVKFWMGKINTKHCKACGSVKDRVWEIKEEDRIAAKKLCDELNEKL